MLVPQGRVVMVSGANRGIGAAVAVELVRRGYSLSLGARRPGSLRAVVAEDDRVVHHAYEAEDPAAAPAWVEATVARFGRLDSLVNVAGVVRDFAIEDPDETALDEMWTVNVKGPLRLIRAALSHLRAAGSGRVVNVASMSGKRVRGTFAPGYAMTKHAVMALSHATRQMAWSDGVRVTALCPSYVATDMSSAFGIDPASMIQPDDLAELVATVLALPDTASVAEVLVNCRLEEY